jgi:hypothetical protein
LLSVILAAAALASAKPAPVVSELRAKLYGRNNADLGDVEFKVVDAGPADRRLSIRCVSKCRAAFSRETNAFPLGAFVIGLSDPGALNITVIWEYPTIDGVTVYHVTPDEVREELVVTTNGGWPRFSADDKGREVIVIPDMIDVGKEERHATTESVYRWNGERFLVDGRPRTRP